MCWVCTLRDESMFVFEFVHTWMCVCVCVTFEVAYRGRFDTPEYACCRTYERERTEFT